MCAVSLPCPGVCLPAVLTGQAGEVVGWAALTQRRSPSPGARWAGGQCFSQAAGALQPRQVRWGGGVLPALVPGARGRGVIHEER